jgi:hypothetical protein
MKRSIIGLMFDLIGAFLFLVSLFILLPLSDSYYVLSLFGMFAGTIFIAIGVAISKEAGKSLEQASEDCYYCKGSGKVNHETCPRCGGTGFPPADT